MINLVLGKLVVNEYFQEAANPEQLSNSLLELVNQPEKRRQIIAELKKAKDVLGNKGTTLRVAEALKEYL